MATKNEVIQYLKSTYPDIVQDGEMYTIKFNVGDGRTQAVLILVLDSFIVAASAFARVGQITDSQALDASSLGHPVTKLDGLYVTTRSMAIQDIDPAEITFVIELTTTAADEIEKSLGLGDNW